MEHRRHSPAFYESQIGPHLPFELGQNFTSDFAKAAIGLRAIVKHPNWWSADKAGQVALGLNGSLGLVKDIGEPGSINQRYDPVRMVC